MKLSNYFTKCDEVLAAPVSVEMSPTISRLRKEVHPSACLNTPASDLFPAPGSRARDILSYASALDRRCRHLFSRLIYHNLFNDSSARSCPENLDYLWCFSLCILVFFCGWKKVGAATSEQHRHYQYRPQPLCLWKITICFARGFEHLQSKLCAGVVPRLSPTTCRTYLGLLVESIWCAGWASRVLVSKGVCSSTLPSAARV